MLQFIMQKGNQDSFALSLLLGSMGRDRLKELGIQNLNIGENENKLDLLADFLEKIKEERTLDNFSDRYMDYLISDLR